jgi:uncharacterized membrane protein YbhN (UPF0104 family)
MSLSETRPEPGPEPGPDPSEMCSPQPRPSGPSRLGRRVSSARSLASVAAVLTLMLAAVPLVSGAPWSGVGVALGRVPWVDLTVLATLWAAGLLAHTFTLTAALPRLTHRRALTLSLTGSAVSNVLPFGGAVGIALNYRMTRSWGFDRGAFAVYTLVTNVWDVLVKLCLPAAALAWLLLSGSLVVGHLVSATVVATAALVVLSLVGVAALSSARVTGLIGVTVDRTIRVMLRAARIRRDVRIGDHLVQVRVESLSVITTAWPRLTAGMLAYTASLAVLLWGCLHVVGAAITPSQVFAGFALERVLTLVGVTPGGAGVVEVGLSGLLVLLGGDPVASVTGVLLYRAFTYGLEIPVGGVGLAAWLWTHRQRRPTTAGVPQDPAFEAAA